MSFLLIICVVLSSRTLDQQRAAERVNDRAEERTYKETMETTVAGTQKCPRQAAKTSTAPRARSSYTGIPDGPGPYPGALGAVLGQF
jgi:hypothetical protein